MSNQIYKIYRVLYKSYGSQGWWPIQSYQKDNGYHKNDFTFPRDDAEVFEVCIGSILTQNTAFNSVVETLKNLTRLHLINAKNILAVDIDILKEAIRPSGYYNQKASYIINFTKFFISLEGNTPTRDELLNIKGIGEETADSILLYGYKQTQMKVDAYTKRMFVHLGLCKDNSKYIDIKRLIENELQKKIKDEDELVKTYQEFHALIVEHGKRYYSKKPYGVGYFLDLKMREIK